MPKLPRMSVDLAKSLRLLQRARQRLHKIQDLHDRLEAQVMRELAAGEQVDDFDTVYGVHHEFAEKPQALVLCRVRSQRLYWRRNVRSRIKHML